MMQIQNGGGMQDCSTAHPGGNNGFDESNVFQSLERWNWNVTIAWTKLEMCIKYVNLNKYLVGFLLQ